MTDVGEPARLIEGPYHAPECNVGDWIDDEVEGRVEVGGWTNARLPWPRRKKTGRASLICTAELVRAIKSESVEAICYWWGVRSTRVWMWRRAFGVPRANPGTRKLLQERTGVPPEAAARGRAAARLPDVRARMAETKRGRPAPINVRKALAAASRWPRTAMTPVDLKQWRYTLKFSMAQASSVLGMSESTLEKYEIAADPIPHYLALACSAAYRLPDVALPKSMAAWRARMRWTQAYLSVQLGFRNYANTVWTMERRERQQSLRRAYLLALLALEHDLLPWHRLRRAHNLKISPSLPRPRRLSVRQP